MADYKDCTDSNGINREIGGGVISEEVQKEAKKHGSPVISGYLVAARRGFTTQVIQAIKEGGSQQANVVDKHGRNCLQLAATHGHFETVYHILQTGLVDINATNKRGLTALHDASMEGHGRIVLLLLALGADITSCTKDGWTCLMSACSNGHYQMASILISTGCSIDEQTKLGLTALHIAAWKGQSDVVQLLLQSGADPNAISYSNKTPLQLAQEENKHHCVSILTASMAKNSEEPMYRISSLEGQLRLAQAKLTEALHKHSTELASQQVQYEEKIVRMKEDLEGQLNEAQKKVEELEKRINLSPRPMVTISRSEASPTPTPPPQPPMLMNRIRHKRKSDGLSSSGSSSKLIESSKHVAPHDGTTDGRSSRLGNRDRVKSASDNDLSAMSPTDEATPIVTDLSSMEDASNGKKSKASKEVAPRKDSTDRLTITDLFEKSLADPCSMSAIRKELKADGLTPKIKRKFQTGRGAPNSAGLQGAKLPSVSPKSSLTQDSRNGSFRIGREVFRKSSNTAEL